MAPNRKKSAPTTQRTTDLKMDSFLTVETTLLRLSNQSSPRDSLLISAPSKTYQRRTSMLQVRCSANLLTLSALTAFYLLKMYQSTLLKTLTHCKFQILINNKFRRNLDQHMLKTLRFEIELTPEKLINFSIYDQQDPASSLYLVTLNNDSFELIQTQ